MSSETGWPVRPGSRLVILNRRNELLMFRHQDSARTYWILPGGGVDPGESWEEAAIRELWEETGIRIRDVELGPCVWRLYRPAPWMDPPVISDQRFFLVRVDDAELSSANQFDYERDVYVETRWWSREELEVSTETHYPEGLAHLVAPLMAGHIPAHPIAIEDTGRE